MPRWSPEPCDDFIGPAVETVCHACGWEKVEHAEPLPVLDLGEVRRQVHAAARENRPVTFLEVPAHDGAPVAT